MTLVREIMIHDAGSDDMRFLSGMAFGLELAADVVDEVRGRYRDAGAVAALGLAREELLIRVVEVRERINGEK